jgi:phosphoglycerate dehydrogenase-like enzyme
MNVAVLTANPDVAPPELPSALAGVNFIFASDTRELSAAMDRSEALFLWDYRSQVVQEASSHARSLKWIHVAGVGVEAVLFKELVESGVILTNSRGIFDRAMAESAIGLMLMFAKDFRRTLRLQALHQWEYREPQMLQGKRLLVAGIGPIGRLVGRLARGLGMEVDGVGRSARPGDADFDRIASSEDMGGALGEADYIVIVLPLTEATRGLFGRTAFERMKPSAYLINLGRGAVIQEEELLAALERGRIAGAALDVFWEEPLNPAHQLWDLPNVIVLPHISGWYVGWQEAAVGLFLDNLARWRRREPLLNVVDKQLGYIPGS